MTGACSGLPSCCHLLTQFKHVIYSSQLVGTAVVDLSENKQQFVVVHAATTFDPRLWGHQGTDSWKRCNSLCGTRPPWQQRSPPLPPTPPPPSRRSCSVCCTRRTTTCTSCWPTSVQPLLLASPTLPPTCWCPLWRPAWRRWCRRPRCCWTTRWCRCTGYVKVGDSVQAATAGQPEAVF